MLDSSPPASCRGVIGYWVVVVLAVGVGIMPLVPPAPGGGTATTDFSVDRALDHISLVAAAPHPLGSSRNERVAAYLASELQTVGLKVERQRVAATDYFGDGSALTAVNVMARITGTDPTGAVAVVGHYDSTPVAPGANDDATAVAIMLEVARVVSDMPPLRNDVILLFTDGEEPAPRFGSTAFVERHPWAGDVEFVVNLEAIGSTGPSFLTATAGPDRWVVDQYLGGARHPTAFSFVTAVESLLGGSNTDFAPFREAGIAGLELVYLHGSPVYHTAADRPGRVGHRSLYQHGTNTLDIVLHVADSDLTLPRDATPVAFVTIARSIVIDYPAGWNLVAAALTGAFAAGLVLTRRRTLHTARESVLVVGVALSLSGAAALTWTLLAGWRDTMGVVESYSYLVAVSALAIVTQAAILRRDTERWPAPSPEAIVVTWWMLAAGTVMVEPSLATPFVLTSFAAAIAVSARRRLGGSTTSVVVASGAALVAVVLIVPMVDFFHQLAQPRPGNPDSEVLATGALPVLGILLLADVILALRPAARTTVAP